jgi:hypothetical protein
VDFRKYMALKMNTLPVDAKRLRTVDRYFLRRLAMAHRKSNKPRVQFANALADTIFVFVIIPIAGLINFLLVVNAKHPVVTKIIGVAPNIGPYALAALAMLVGYVLLNKRMKKHVEQDSTCYLQFCTEKDAEIAFWQRAGAVIIIGIFPAFLALLILA